MPCQSTSNNEESQTKLRKLCSMHTRKYENMEIKQILLTRLEKH